MSDTSPATVALLARLHRALPPGTRVSMALSMSEACRRVTESGVRARLPTATDDEVRWEVAKLYLGEALTERVRAWRAR